LSWQLGGGVTASGSGRFGFDDREGKGRLELRWERASTGIRAYARRDYQDVGDVAERSTLVNSLAAQEFGSDFTDLFRREAAGVELWKHVRSWRMAVDMSSEREARVGVHASPATGRFEPALPADSLEGVRAELTLERPWTLTFAGFESRARVSVSGLEAGSVVRASGDVELQRPIGIARFVSRTIAAGASASGPLPRQSLVYFGGPISAPGYDYHTLVADAALSQRLEIQLPVPFPSFSLGRFGRSGASATAAPFVTAVVLDRGAYPSVGLGVLTFFDILRFDVARGLRDGRWSFYVDVNRAFWSVL
jgi:hypothetical protein